jgi:predicted ATPase/DNA-binding winged helix-turn-helix (wHTH) protein
MPALESLSEPGRESTRSALAPDRIEIDTSRRLLWVEGRPVLLGGRAFDLLVCLASRPGHTFGPDELVAAAWPGRVVEASNLRVQVNALRKALGSDVIANVPGRGYLFAGRAYQRAERLAPGLIGRDEELQVLAARLAQERLVTVVGPGGIGKTRLVRAWWEWAAQSDDDGISLRAWADLAPLGSAEALLPAIAAAFDLAAPPQGAAWSLPSLVLALGLDAPALLVLDNAEPLAAALASVLPQLLQAAPMLRLVVTSQMPLHLPQESLLRLGTLECPVPGTALDDARRQGAVALFVARAQAAQPGFTLTEQTLAPVAELCRRLDGLPLAIELAAARLPTLGLASLLRTLDERLHLLTQHPSSAPLRQRTLRAALAWTHGLLDERTRVVFARVAVFASPFTHEAAQQVVADEAPGAAPAAAHAAAVDRWAVLYALQVLFDASLLVPTAGEPPRLRMLETPRLFALEQLRASGEEPLLRQRHVQWCNTWLSDATPQRLREGLEELSAALAWVQAGAEGATTLARRLAQHPALADLRGRWPAAGTGGAARPEALASAQARGLIDRLGGDALQAQAQDAGLTPQALLALAERLGGEDALQLETARAELERALQRAADVVQTRIAAEDDDDESTALGHGDLARAALEAASEAARSGLLDQAAEEVNEALAELERRELRRAAAVRRVRHRLLDAGVQHDLLRRDANSVAARLAAIVELEEPQRPAGSGAWRAQEQYYLNEGHRLAAPLYLDVAAVLARRRAEAANTPAETAHAQRTLAKALTLRGIRQSASDNLVQAAAAARRALAAQAREDDVVSWAGAQAELAAALYELGRRRGDRAMLVEALAAAESSLQVFSATSHPDDWAAAQHARASALLWLGARDTDTVKLQAAHAGLMLALEVRHPERTLQDWVRSRNQMGTALSIWAGREAGVARRRQAITHHRQTLLQMAPEQLPGEWATAQNLLGIDHMMLAMEEDRTANLLAAEAALRALLSVARSDSMPSLWSNGHHNLGIVLGHLGLDQRDQTLLRQSIAAYRVALDNHTPSEQPLAHAAGQNEVATALWRLAELLPQDDPQALPLLDQALEAMAQVLALRTREGAPLDWARSQSDLGRFLLAKANRLSSRSAAAATAQAALEAAEAALSIATADSQSKEHELASGTRDAARAWLAANAV